MKKIIFAALILIALFALCGCGNKPAKVAQQFLNSVEKNDFEEARKLATQDSQDVLIYLQNLLANMTEEQRMEQEKKQHKILSTQITDETATVSYEEWIVTDPGNKTTQNLTLVKEDKEWKVKLSRK